MVDVLSLLLLGGAVGIGGAITAVDRRARRGFITRVRTDWTRSAQVVKFGPVGAFYYGSRPQRKYVTRVYGALGIVSDKLVFEGHRSNSAVIHEAAIRWIGIRSISFYGGAAQILIVHSDDLNGWTVHTFMPDQLMEFAEALSRYTDLPLHQFGEAHEDYGPARTTRVLQDIYGEWSEDRKGKLYLAPDRLLFEGKDPILLSQIRQVDVFVKGRLNPADLLRIEYETPDGGLHTMGFVVKHAEQWADAIQGRSEVRLSMHIGRKKKET